MGATGFTTYRDGADLATAYRHAVRDAVEEYGNDGYNGTISTTEGVYRVRIPRPLTRAGAALYADQHYDDAEKWGPALAVPVAPDDRFAFGTAKFTVTLEDGDDESWSPTGALEEKARARAFELHGAQVHDVKIKPTIKTKVVTTAAAGKSVLKWQAGGHRLFDTKTEALRHARESAPKAIGGVGVKQVRVWPESTFHDKTLAAQVTNATVRATAEVTVTLAVPKTTLVQVEGWLFFGLAAC